MHRKTRLRDLPPSATAASCSFHIFGTLVAPCMVCVSYKMGQKEKNRKGHVVCWTSCLLAAIQATQSIINIHTEHMGCVFFTVQSSSAHTHTHPGCTHWLGTAVGALYSRRRGGGGERERERTGSGERERLDSFRHHRSLLKQQFLEGSFPVHAVDQFKNIIFLCA